MEFDRHKSIQIFLKYAKQSFESSIIYNIISTYETNVHQNKDLQKHLYDNSFIGSSVKKDIEQSQLVYTEITYKHHNIYLYVPVRNEPPNIKLICTIINFYELLGKHYGNKINNVNLVVIYSNAKKQINNLSKILTRDHINSGATYPGKIIICFRKEEFYKVFIHELFHYYRFDFHINDKFYNKLVEMLNIPRIEGSDYINESYTESCALIIYTIMKYYIKKINTSFNEYFGKMLNTEINFTISQIAKTCYIVHKQPEYNIHTKMYNYTDPMKEYKINKKIHFELTKALLKQIFIKIFEGEIIMHQTTSWRSYFLIKLVLIFNIYNLLNFIDMNINVQNERLIEFGELINKSMVYFKDNFHFNVSEVNNSMCFTHNCGAI